MPIRRRVQTESTPIALNTVSGNARTYDVAASQHLQRNRSVVRSAELVAAIAKLDTATDPQYAAALMAWIRDEYAAREGGTLIGLFARCYLGPPYVDHRLDITAVCILEHYSPADSPPPPFASARSLARNSAYAYVEVYDDGQVVPIRPDGNPTT